MLCYFIAAYALLLGIGKIQLAMRNRIGFYSLFMGFQMLLLHPLPSTEFSAKEFHSEKTIPGPKPA